jgi:HTH-type transcriptional regulator / antitoxin HigA
MKNTTRKPGKKGTTSFLKRLNEIQASSFVTEYLGSLRDDKSYHRAKSALEELIMTTPDSPDNPYNGLIEILGDLVEKYEEQHHPLPTASPVDVLKYLMEEHGLKQNQLPEIGNQAKVSEVLNNKRALNLNHVKALSRRFGVSPSVFIGD